MVVNRERMVAQPETYVNMRGPAKTTEALAHTIDKWNAGLIWDCFLF